MKTLMALCVFGGIVIASSTSATAGQLKPCQIIGTTEYGCDLDEVCFVKPGSLVGGVCLKVTIVR